MQNIYCPICNNRLFDLLKEGGEVSIKCCRCKAIVLFDGKNKIFKDVSITYRAKEPK